MHADFEDRPTTHNEPDQGAGLPDVPDAGPDSQPITPPEPVDISTGTLTADAGRVASYISDGDDRSLYEQALDDPSASPMSDAAIFINPPAGLPPNSTDRPGPRRARIYSREA